MKYRTLSEMYDIQIDEDVFNPIYLPYLEMVKRYEVYYGGAGSGKSTFIAQKLAIQMSMMEGRNLVCFRKQAVDAKESVLPELKAALAQFGFLEMWNIVESPTVRMTNMRNGNVILLAGIDDVENIKSIKFTNLDAEGKVVSANLTDVWYEEATEEREPRNITQLDLRLRDPKHQCRIILSFNPVSSTHWIKHWMEVKMSDKASAKKIICLKTNYADNKFLKKDYIALLESYRYTDPYIYQVYALGNWGTMGQTVFDANKISARLEYLYSQEDRHIRFVEFSFDRAANGIPIWKDATCLDKDGGETIIYKMPEKNHPYVIAFDTAGEGSDYYAAHCVDNVTDEQVAVFNSQQDPVFCLHQILCLAYMYNEALLCPEINFDSYPIKKMQEYGYRYIYQREKPPDGFDKSYDLKLGFRTTSENRQRILSNMVEYMKDHINCVNDVQTLNDMLSFTRQAKKNKGIWWGAESGAHDDLVMAYAILLVAKTQQESTAIGDRHEIKGFWFPEELEYAVEEGKIDDQVAQEYLEKKEKQSLWDAFSFGKRSRR